MKKTKIDEYKWIPFEYDDDLNLISPLPEIEQQILVSNGRVIRISTFMNDCESIYIECDALSGYAWMPLPKQYVSIKDCVVTDNSVITDDFTKRRKNMKKSKMDGCEWIPFEYDDDFNLVCLLSEIGQEILVSNNCGIWIDTFMCDCDSYYIESGGVLSGYAWMPLPKPYVKSDKVQRQGTDS